MAYGQTGTGKTYTLGRLGDEDVSARGIMVRSMEDILANICLETDSVSVSYLQVGLCFLNLSVNTCHCASFACSEKFPLLTTITLQPNDLPSFI